MINVIGLGYIGLPTALMLASHGVEVVGTDYNKELVDTLNAGHTTFKEDGLDELFQNALDAGIKFSLCSAKSSIKMHARRGTLLGLSSTMLKSSC